MWDSVDNAGLGPEYWQRAYRSTPLAYFCIREQPVGAFWVAKDTATHMWGKPPHAQLDVLVGPFYDLDVAVATAELLGVWQ